MGIEPIFRPSSTSLSESDSGLDNRKSLFLDPVFFSPPSDAMADSYIGILATDEERQPGPCKAIAAPPNRG